MRILEKLDLIKLVQELHEEHKELKAIVLRIDEQTTECINSFYKTITDLKAEHDNLLYKLDTFSDLRERVEKIEGYFKEDPLTDSKDHALDSLFG